MASIVCQNFGLPRIQKYAFELRNDTTNPMVNCEQQGRINLDLFKKY